MLKLYGYPRSRSTRVAWTLEEAGAGYDYVNVDLAKGEARAASYLQINPAGKVPALVDGDLVLTESAAICLYVADKFPAAGLAPPADRLGERATCLQWLFFVTTELEQPLWTIFKHGVALPQERRVPSIKATAEWEFGNAAKVLDQHLAGRTYMIGDRFTIVDIVTALTLRWAVNMDLPLASAATDAYAGAMLDRPALARAMAREIAA